MARTAHNRRLHRKKTDENREARPQAFEPVADEMMRRAREEKALAESQINSEPTKNPD